MKLQELKIGDKVATWHDAGCRGPEIVGCEVIKLGKAKVKVRDDAGKVAWVYADIFHGRLSESAFQRLTSREAQR